MYKTPTQRLLEAQRGSEIRDIVISELERVPGQFNVVQTAATSLDISHETLREWCANLGIDLQDYGVRRRVSGRANQEATP